MRRIVLAALLLPLAASAALAGPQLDRVLDYMFMDQTVPYKNVQQQFDDQRHIQLTKDTHVGQTFVTGPETGVVARIRAHLAPTKEWQPGEGAELTLWDSPEKKNKLGSYTIWYENREFHYWRADWDLNVPVNPNTSCYFEITYAGEGDGKLGQVGVMNGADAYKGGQGYLNAQEADFDICFQVHSRRKPDPIGNLKKAFARFDLGRHGLERVKAAVEKEDFGTAVAETVAYFESPARPYPIVNREDVPKPGPSEFIEQADSLMNATWRQVDFGRYGGKKIFTRAYLATGDNKYAKKLNDLMIEWFVNSPPPSESNIGGCPWDPMWSSLETGIRVGHQFVAYSAIHSSPEFTTDCRMAYIISLADHCNTLVKHGAHAGGNWSFTQNSSLLTFAMNYPEFKAWETWRDTAIQRLADSLRKDTLPDGPETESAFGYQRFSYRPLAGVYDDLILKRGLKTPFSEELGRLLERQAEYFMYAAMPNGITPYLGDWGHDDARGWADDDAKRFSRQDMLYVATAGKQGTKPKEITKLYPCAGLAMMRSDWGDASTSPSFRRGPGGGFEDARYLLLHGVHFGAHGHSDINSIPALYAYGRELLTDPGCHEYGSREHALLCTAVSHNLMTIDGRDQDIWGKTAFRNWSTTPVADYISSWASVYKGPDQTREVLYARSNGDSGARDYWVVRDSVGGAGTYLLEQRWHFALDSNLSVDSSALTARTRFPERGNLAILQVDQVRLGVDETTTDTWTTRGKFDVPPSKLPTVIYSARAAVPAAFDTLLVPYGSPNPPKLRLEIIETSKDGLDSAFKVTQGNVVDLYVFQRAGQAKRMPAEKVAFDGARLFVRRVDGKLRSALLVNGKSLRVNGRDIVSVGKQLPWIAIAVDTDGVSVYTSADAPTLKVPIAEGRKLAIQNMDTDALIDPNACKMPK